MHVTRSTGVSDSQLQGQSGEAKRGELGENMEGEWCDLNALVKFEEMLAGSGLMGLFKPLTGVRGVFKCSYGKGI